jgi:hypothetical protein
MKSRFKRGGGSLCSNSVKVWKIFRKTIESIEGCDVKRRSPKQFSNKFNDSITYMTRKSDRKSFSRSQNDILEINLKANEPNVTEMTTTEIMTTKVLLTESMITESNTTESIIIELTTNESLTTELHTTESIESITSEMTTTELYH